MSAPATSPLSTWHQSEHSHPVNGRATAHPVYRKGTGPGVIVIHEMPGLTREVIGFAEELVAAGYTVVMPHLFGKTEAPITLGAFNKAFAQACISREFTLLRLGRTAPIADWLRSLARELDSELRQAGVPATGVGAIGMCFTGGFALAMMVNAPVVAPVLAQPAMPLGGAKAKSDLGLDPTDLQDVKAQCAAGRQVLGMRFSEDPLSPAAKFDTLAREIGDAFIRIELPGKAHSTVTVDRRDEFVNAVLTFLDRHLCPADEATDPPAPAL